ncbi:MAG: hypothetical protein ABJB40_12325 [Acidobacteriota bacterium]
MKRFIAKKNITGILAMLLLFGVGAAIAQKPVLRHRRPVARKKVVAKPAIPMYAVASGTVLHVRMNRTISSKTARVGDTFTVNVTEPVYSSNGVVVIPTGSTATARVSSVVPAANQGKPGQIDARFVSIHLPNGRIHTINGSLTELTGNTNSDNEGGVSGKPMNNRKLIFIGGGGVGGAVLGAAIGGGKGALIGGILGAGGGFLGDRYTKGKEAEVKSGTEFGVYLNQAISLPRFAETTMTNQ